MSESEEYKSISLPKIDTSDFCKRFDRTELINIRERAVYWALADGINLHWHRAFLDLADAVDRLDTMHARTVIAVMTKEAIPPSGHEE